MVCRIVAVERDESTDEVDESTDEVDESTDEVDEPVHLLLRRAERGYDLREVGGSFVICINDPRPPEPFPPTSRPQPQPPL